MEGISGKQLEGTRTKQQVCSVGGASSSTYASTSLPSSLPRFSTGPVTLFALGERVDADSVDSTACSVIKRNKEEGEKRRKEEEGGGRRKEEEEGGGRRNKINKSSPLHIPFPSSRSATQLSTRFTAT